MKEGARAERGTVLFSLSCFSGFSGPPNQADGIGQIDQLPDTGYQMLDGKTWPSFFTRKRMVWGGRAQVRATLYMAAIVATRYNPTIKTFYQRLCGLGKAKKVALVACMRKLLTILNAMLKSGTPWRGAASQPT